MDEKLKVVVETVKTRSRMNGLKYLYYKYQVPKEKRQVWRDLWNMVAKDLGDDKFAGGI